MRETVLALVLALALLGLVLLRSPAMAAGDTGAPRG